MFLDTLCEEKVGARDWEFGTSGFEIETCHGWWMAMGHLVFVALVLGVKVLFSEANLVYCICVAMEPSGNLLDILNRLEGMILIVFYGWFLNGGRLWQSGSGLFYHPLHWLAYSTSLLLIILIRCSESGLLNYFYIRKLRNLLSKYKAELDIIVPCK